MYSRFFTAVLLCLAVSVAAYSQKTSQADVPRELNLPAGSLSKALEKLGDQSGIQIIYESSLADGIRVAALNGTYSVRDALAHLLANTGLTADSPNDKMVVLKRADPKTSGVSPADQMRVAGLSAESSRSQTSESAPAAEDARQQITVEGQRDRPAPFSTANIDLTRTEDDVLPFQVFTSEEIQRSGAADLAEFFRNRLTQNSTTSIREESYTNGFASARSVSGTYNSLDFVNGTGSRDLLILLNGRRLPPAYSALSFDQSASFPDFRGIPVASIERIELLSSAAGAIYGGSATGGVINIITRRNYTGGSISLRNEQPFDASAPKRSLDLAYSMPMSAGARLNLSYSINDQRPLKLRDRVDVMTGRVRQILQERQPTRLNNLLLGATTNIVSADGSALFGPGTPNRTSVPDGYAGGEGLEPFTTRQGVFNLDLPDGNNGTLPGLDSLLGMKSRTQHFHVGWEQKLRENLQLFVAYSRLDTELKGKSHDHFNGLGYPVASATAPSNPFGRNVRVLFYDPRMDLPGLKQESGTESDRWNASLVGQRGDWRGLLDLSFIRDINEQRDIQFNMPLHPETGESISWSTAIDLGFYNPFVDMRTVAPAEQWFYENYNQAREYFLNETRNYQVSAKLSGPVFNLPAGRIDLTAGVEWLRQERVRVVIDQTNAHSRTGERIPYINVPDMSVYPFTLDAYSVYSEANVPLISAAHGIPAVRSLDIFLSARISSQRTEGWRQLSDSFVLDPQNGNRVYTSVKEAVKYDTEPYLHVIGLRYQPVPDFTLRISRATGFTPPTLTQISPSLPSIWDEFVTDPATGMAVVLTPSMYIDGGNPQLDPETTTSDSIGIVAQPRWLPGMRLSIDYTYNRRNNAITSLGVQGALDLEATDPIVAARIQRDSNGELIFVDGRYINFNKISSRTLNLALEHRIANVGTGSLVLRGAATKFLSLLVQSSPTAPAAQRIDVRTFDNTSNWNANAQVHWEGPSLTLGWSTRYYDDFLLPPSAFAAQGSDRIEWALEHDFYASCRPRAGGGMFGHLLDGAMLSLGVKNVFDRAPRLDTRSAERGYFGADSIYGRSFWLELRADF